MVGGISNLLAEITGEKPSSSPAPVPRTNPLPKRKAPSELRREPLKAARTGPEPGSRPAAQPARTLNRPDGPAQPERPADRPTPPSNRPALTSRPADKTATPGRYNGSAGRKPSSVGPGRPAPATAPPASRPPAPAAAQKPLKKGSFAEIMARAQAAQASMGPVGAIQHKKVERTAVKKEKDKEDGRLDTRSLKGKTARHGSQGLPSRQGAAPASRDRPRGGSLPLSSKAKKSAEPEPEKKVRKPPTTGYVGTARPRANAPASSREKNKLSAAGGVLLNPQLARSRAPKRSRHDEEEEDDMSDFIEYDEEEDETELGGRGGGPRRHYYSDEDESDMEAGLDEIDDEEAEAEYIARQDDRREQQLEKRLKLEKERRKREALESIRRGR